MFKKFHQVVIDWAPYVFLAFFYENIHYLADLLKIPSRDAWLLIIDKLLAGGKIPNLLLQKIETPPLTDWLSLVYLLYLPLVVAQINGGKPDTKNKRQQPPKKPTFFTPTKK